MIYPINSTTRIGHPSKSGKISGQHADLMIIIDAMKRFELKGDGAIIGRSIVGQGSVLAAMGNARGSDLYRE